MNDRRKRRPLAFANRLTQFLINVRKKVFSLATGVHRFPDFQGDQVKIFKIRRILAKNRRFWSRSKIFLGPKPQVFPQILVENRRFSTDFGQKTAGFMLKW